MVDREYREYKPYIEPEKPNYGKIKYFGIFNDINIAGAFIFIVFLLSLIGITFTARNNMSDMDNAKIFGKSTVTYHDNRDRIEDILAKDDAIKKRKEFIRDSILREIYVRDSIRKELMRQDSINSEFTKLQQVYINYLAIIDDGVTRRTVNVESIADADIDILTSNLGIAFQEMTVNTVRDRQDEIDKNPEYYSGSLSAIDRPL